MNMNMREDDEVKNIISEKKKLAEKNATMKYKQYENEIDKKRKDEDKIELMTQFMLDPTSSATKLLEKRREMYELQEALQKDKEKFNEKETQFKKTEEELRNRDEDFHKKICEYYMNRFFYGNLHHDFHKKICSYNIRKKTNRCSCKYRKNQS